MKTLRIYNTCGSCGSSTENPVKGTTKGVVIATI